MPLTELLIPAGIAIHFIVFPFVWRWLYVIERDGHLEKLDTDASYKRRFEANRDGPAYFIMFLGALSWPIVLVVAVIVEAIPWLWKHTIGRETPYERKLRQQKEAKEVEALVKEFDLGLEALAETPKKWETTFDRKLKGLTLDDFMKNIENRFPKKSKSWQRGQAILQYQQYQEEWEA